MSQHLAGVSMALPYEDFALLPRDAQRAVLMEASDKLAADFQRHVGQVRPRSQPTFGVDGPHSDPLQGLILVATLSAFVEVDELPADCTAYLAHYADTAAVHAVAPPTTPEV